MRKREHLDWGWNESLYVSAKDLFDYVPAWSLRPGSDSSVLTILDAVSGVHSHQTIHSLKSQVCGFPQVLSVH